ncbi:MAG: LptF/LptG family permease [Balneolaceae bacterium]
MSKLDRYIVFRLFTITLFVLLTLICIFILIDFSENSDDFADKGATLAEIWSDYYLKFIPEMVRLVSPLAVFVACLILTGQMTERLEIMAIKASGISLYRLAVPFLFFGLMVAGAVSYLDSSIIPESNADRAEFEQRYLGGAGERLDRGGLYRQIDENTIIHFTFFDAVANVGYTATIVEFEDKQIRSVGSANRFKWEEAEQHWVANRFQRRTYNEKGYTEIDTTDFVMTMDLFPRDLTRRSSDIYELSYQDAFHYIETIQRIGAGGLSLPRTHLYSRMAYPISIFVVSLIGFAIATERRKSGKGFYIAAGLVVSFIYLVFMKVLEPIGSAGTIAPETAALFPHLFFLLAGLFLLLFSRK